MLLKQNTIDRPKGYVVKVSNIILMFIVHMTVLLTQYCAGDKIEKNEMGWACGMYG